MHSNTGTPRAQNRSHLFYILYALRSVFDTFSGYNQLCEQGHFTGIQKTITEQGSSWALPPGSGEAAMKAEGQTQVLAAPCGILVLRLHTCLAAEVNGLISRISCIADQYPQLEVQLLGKLAMHSVCRNQVQ